MIYHFYNFVEKDQIVINESLFEQARYPFTDQNVRDFFSYFWLNSFSFNGVVRSIVITGGAIKPPNLNSFADGLLMPYSADEFRESGKTSDTVGLVYITCCPDKGTRDITVE